MRVFAAGCFVVVVVGIAGGFLASSVELDDDPPVVALAVIGVIFVSAITLAMWLFHSKGSDPFRLLSNDEYLARLEAYGLLEKMEFHAIRAFQVEESYEEGRNYFLELDDGRVLFMSGQYLFEYEPSTGDEDEEDEEDEPQERRFPCTDFTILRHKTEGYVIDLQCGGDIIEPELTAPTFDRKVWQDTKSLMDGDIITRLTYDEIKRRCVR